ncbi:hypothetical protein COO60DRAFT_1643851 [Scenedesmus sp. NREL 46B-D3]|nr:hypothetical protein COO60DRAFT_1643851 [Scenedesmus sp. NREL 46B-D3]
MCFNARVSITTYLVGLAGCAELYRQGRAAEAMFYAWVVHMQLIEFFLWRLQPQCSADPAWALGQNALVSKAGLIINHLEPVVLWLAISYLPQGSRQLPGWMHAVMVGFVLATAEYSRRVLSEQESLVTTVTPESAPHLHWKWNEGRGGGLYYAAFVAVLCALAHYGLAYGRQNTVIIAASFAASFAVYGKQHSVGAMWCFAASLAPWLLLALA